MIEIEKRGFLSKEKYDSIIRFLDEKAQSLGQDDKDVIYYIYTDKLLKVVNNISKGTSKISLKMNKIGEGSVFPETEIGFEQKDFEKLKFIIDTVAVPKNIIRGTQKRKNYIYKGCELSIKWSEDWSYHFEIEKMIDDESKGTDAEAEIHLIAEELGIKILTDQELKEFNERTGQ